MFSGQLHVEKDDQHRSAWLTEGAAEYFGGALDSKRRNAAGEPIQELFNQCLSATGSQPVNSQGHSAISHATYRCGEFLIGALSLMLGDSHSVSSVWLEMLQPDSLNGTAFSTDEIFDIVQRLGIVHFESIADLTLNQEGLARWQKIQSEMAGTGADVEFTYIQAVRAEGTRLIRQLLTRHCRGASGFKSDESLLTLYTPNCSGGFKDSAEVVQIESHPIRNVGAWVNSIVDRCSRAESIMFTLKDGDEMPIHCE